MISSKQVVRTLDGRVLSLLLNERSDLTDKTLVRLSPQGDRMLTRVSVEGKTRFVRLWVEEVE